MTNTTNRFGQPVGDALNRFTPPPPPAFHRLSGHSVYVKSLSSEDLPTLYQAFSIDIEGKNWTYLPYGPFSDLSSFTAWAESSCFGKDPEFYAIVLGERPAGLASYLRIEPEVGRVEIGHIHLSPLLQRTRAGTEALMMMIERVFQLGYRRLEWKCDALNEPSRRAACRFGFSFEGIFRQATIVKSRNRDTAWYAITDKEWPRLEEAYHIWKQTENFDPDGREIQKLSMLTLYGEGSGEKKSLS